MFVNFFNNLIKSETYLGLWEGFKKHVTLENMILLKDKCWNAIKWIVNKLGKIVIITLALLVFALVLVGVGIYIIFMLISAIFKIISYCSNWVSNKIDRLLELFRDFVVHITNKINVIANPEKLNDFNNVTTISPEVIKEVINAAKEEANKKVEG